MKFAIAFLCFFIVENVIAQDSSNCEAIVPTTDSTAESELVVIIEYNGREYPIESYFRDQTFGSSRELIIPIFPSTTSQYRLPGYFNDNKSRYSDFGNVLYNKELVELRDKESKVWETPLLEFAAGRDLTADSAKQILQNTRGVRIEGSFGSRLFFTTSFYENQSILPSYARNYVLSRGEFYPNQSDSSYIQVNGVVPGAARTKPFGDNGFDYAYAVGGVTLRINGRMRLSWGNTSSFIGSGYRSMLWSDNSVGSMNLRFRWNFARRFEFETIKMRGFNLLRRIGGVNGEAFYEPSSISMSTIYYAPTSNFCIGVFEGSTWNRGDSINKTPAPALFYSPIPGSGLLQEAIDGKSNTLVGLDAQLALKDFKFYGQFALNPFQNQSSVMQLGFRFSPSIWKYSYLQVEYNQAERNAYSASNPRLNYANYNLPMAHAAGNNFQEVLLRANYEFDHWFVSVAGHYFPTQSVDPTLLPIYTQSTFETQQVVITSLEGGYRFNRNYRLEVFGKFLYRKAEGVVVNESSWISAGVRTAIRNHYFDF